MTSNITADAEQLERALMEMAVEGWRFSRLFGRVLGKLEASDGARYAKQLRCYTGKLADNLHAAGLTLVDIEGQPFTAGVAATALNVGDFQHDDELLIDQMMEPIIMGPAGPRRLGTVMLRKAQA
jgi:hypothetical protein